METAINVPDAYLIAYWISLEAKAYKICTKNYSGIFSLRSIIVFSANLLSSFDWLVVAF
jgi:hypothetical protein